jgi:hypothetical protein
LSYKGLVKEYFVLTDCVMCGIRSRNIPTVWHFLKLLHKNRHTFLQNAQKNKLRIFIACCVLFITETKTPTQYVTRGPQPKKFLHRIFAVRLHSCHYGEEAEGHLRIKRLSVSRQVSVCEARRFRTGQQENLWFCFLQEDEQMSLLTK